MSFKIKRHAVTLLLPLMLLCSCGSHTHATQAQLPGTHPTSPPAFQSPVVPATPAAQAAPAPAVAIAPPPLTGFALWVAEFKYEALEKGITQPVLDDAFADVTEPLPHIIEQDHTQPEKTRTFANYLRGFMMRKKIDAARAQWDSHRELLDQVQKKYGVPAPVMLTLWMIESGFGHVQGDNSIVQSLVTLAYDGRRSAFFRKELLNALVILQQEHMRSKDLTGSWAGAMGQVQFMPSSFLAFATDFDGDGKKDIWKSDADAVASMANYLHTRHWDASSGWGLRVRVPKKNHAAEWVAGKQKHTLKQWQKLGLRRKNGGRLPASDQLARLVMPDDDISDAYLVFANYDVIMDWNRSTYFATTVGLFSDALAAAEKNDN
jgi:membrane-bound lytic murein transglycosylase B